jgi:uridine kinase
MDTGYRSGVEIEPVLKMVRRAASQESLVLVGIGGHGGSGKTTLAHALPATHVVHVDGFWNGATFDLDRFDRDVVEPLRQRQEGRYCAWDWSAGEPGRDLVVVKPFGIVVIEGVCALHRRFRDAYAVRVWVETPYEVRLARGVARDGETARGTWVDRWMPSEDRYVVLDDPVSCAHLVVDGSGSVPAIG